MSPFLPLATLALSALLLILLAAIDLRTRLLPNVLVLAFAMLGYAFHLSTLFSHLAPADMLSGAVIGGGFLLLIRTAGNYYYKQDTLGLGDVKLMAAAGLWLGPEGILIALSLGGVASLIHGGVDYTFAKARGAAGPSLGQHGVPAGPGFIVGIVLAGLAKFSGLAHLAF